MKPHFRTLDFISNTVRLKEILFVLARHGFGEVIETLGLPNSWIETLIREKPGNQTIWKRIRLTLEDLGPTFVKFGQVLVNRPDLLPEPLLTELRQLRSQVRPVPFEDMRDLLERELGGPVESVFASFDTTPKASGSIGQVYRARLRAECADVAVKVQRPGIRKAIRADIDIMRWLANRLHDNLDDLRPYDLPDIVESTGEGMTQELDFSIEAINATLFNRSNPYAGTVFAPHVHEAYTTPLLAISEWVEGLAPDAATLPPEISAKLARNGGDSVFHQIFLSGFFHGDPHCGNVLITPDHRICFIDWGLAGQLTRAMRYFLADLFSAVASADAEKVVQVASMMAETNRRVDTIKAEKEVALVLRRYVPKLQSNDVLGTIILELLYVLASNGIRLARDYSLLAKAVISIEEVGHTLDPNFDVRAVSKPFLERLARERWDPRNVIRLSLSGLLNNARRLQEIPQDLQRLLRNVTDGEWRLNMRLEGMSSAEESFDSGVNRLVLALITASLIMGSSFIMASTIDKETSLGELFELPAVVGTLGYVLSGFFGVITIIDILRHGRHKRRR